MVTTSSLIVAFIHIISFVMSADVQYSVPEQSKSGLLIGNIPESIDLANLVSTASLPYMKYSFLSIDSNLRKYFFLNDKTGDLRLSFTEVLDREVICQFDVNCIIELQIAIQSTQTQFFRKVLVSIDVIDINDHAPQFKENFTTLTISESVQVPSSFPLPSAIDKDTGANNSLQMYEIFPQDGPFELAYSKLNSNLMLRVIRELDHETRDLYSIKIIARDGGDPPREGVLNADVIVEDINDNAPVFTQDNYAKVVDETVSQGSLLLTVKATDRDSGKNGQIRYRLSPQQSASVLSTFSVDEILGDLRLVGDFQNADTELYKIDIEASDMADQPFTSKTTVSITVEDTINSRPKLLISYLSQNNYSSISEYANLGVAVAHILVKDTDRGPNGIVQCNMTTGGYFELQSYDVKEYKVIVARPLDRETISVHNVTVECFDAGLPPLSTSETFQIRVTDENDNAPQFPDKSYNVTIRENNEVGKEIMRVIAVDLDDPFTGNGDITYSLQDVNKGEFLINPDTGAIKVMVSFDYEFRRQINFTVVAEDNGIPRRSAKVPIGVSIHDENDQVPYFAQSRFTISVSEYASPGNIVGDITAFDFEQGRNGLFEITLIPGSGRSRKSAKNGVYFNSRAYEDSLSDYEEIDDANIPFEVRQNGSLVLAAELDHETRSSYEFEVRVTDKGVPPLSDTATVVIDVIDENDNAPYILHPNVSEVVFTALTGSDAPISLMSFDVVDKDSGSNSLLVFTVTARNDSGRFEIDDKGEVMRTRDFNNKDAGTYKLSIMVKDSGTPPKSDFRTLLIHVTSGNGTTGRPGPLSDQYIVIALTLVCVTILLSVTIILIIVIMKRLDRRRKGNNSVGARAPMHIHNSRVVTAFVDPIKMDNFRNGSTDSDYRDEDIGSMDDHKMNDSQFGFSFTSASINKGSLGDSGYQSSQVNNLSLPTSASKDEEIDLEAIQLHHVLLQTFQDSQAVVMIPEDGASDSSAETITSDSGRGGSDEDISNANMAAGNSVDGSRTGHNGSFQSCTSTFGQLGSLKSSVKDPVRSSARKHVTFKDSDRARHIALSQSGLPTGPCSNDLTSNSASPVAALPSHQLKKPVCAYSEIFSPGAQQNMFGEMNIPVSRDNSNAHADNPKSSVFAGLLQSKISPRGVPSAFNFGDNYNRESPRLLTFAAESPPQQQQFQNPGSAARLAHYCADDPVPSPMPKESPSEWRHSPKQPSQDSLAGKTYIHMNSSQDLQKQQQKNYNRSLSPKAVLSQQLSLQESPSSSSINSHRNTEAVKSMVKPTSPFKDCNRDQYCTDRTSDNIHFNPLFAKQRANHVSPDSESQATLFSPRELTLHNDPNLIQNSLLDKELIKFSTSPIQNKGALSPRDWKNDSIATNDDFDDQRSTTTSGSYTIDNEDEYLALEFKPKDIVV